MSVYETTEDGEFKLGRMAIPNDTSNWHYQQMMLEVSTHQSTITPYVTPPDPRTVRDKRQERYITELSPEGNFHKTVGDMLDALVKAVYGDTTELDALVIKINKIKTELPPGS
jgi:hypothetical protein